jgi:hypothetical protein
VSIARICHLQIYKDDTFVTHEQYRDTFEKVWLIIVAPDECCVDIRRRVDESDSNRFRIADIELAIAIVQPIFCVLTQQQTALVLLMAKSTLKKYVSPS